MGKPNLNTVPAEIQRQIAEYITCGEIFALVLTSRRLYPAFIEALYEEAGKSLCYAKALLWAVTHRIPWAVKAVLRHGTQFNLQLIWISRQQVHDVSYFTCDERFQRWFCRCACDPSQEQCPGYGGGCGYYDTIDIPAEEADAVCYSLNHPPSYLWSMLYIAAALDNSDILEILLRQSCGTETVMDMGCPNLCPCGDKPRTLGPGVIEDTTMPKSQAWSVLHVAICKGNIEAAKLLVSYGASQPLAKAFKTSFWRNVRYCRRLPKALTRLLACCLHHRGSTLCQVVG